MKNLGYKVSIDKQILLAMLILKYMKNKFPWVNHFYHYLNDLLLLMNVCK